MLPRRTIHGKDKPDLSWRRRDRAMEVFAYHESFVRNVEVQHWRKSTMKMKSARDKDSFFDVVKRHTHLESSDWPEEWPPVSEAVQQLHYVFYNSIVKENYTQDIWRRIVLPRYAKGHPPIGNEDYDTRNPMYHLRMKESPIPYEELVRDV